MQKRLCNVDQDVAVMLSPSKLAAERIYSTKRNSISFHAALQSGSPEQAIASFERPVQDTVPVVPQKPTFPTLAQQSYPLVQEPSQETVAALYQAPLHVPDTQALVNNQKMMQDNDQQFKLVQQQIDLLRKVVAATGAPVPPPAPQPIIVTVPTPSAPVQAMIPVQAQAPSLPVVTSLENNSLFLLLQKLVFAAIFLVGLLRIVEWIVEKATNLIVPDEKEKPSRPSSRSSSSSFSFR